MKRNPIISNEPKVEKDLSNYKIIEQNFPFKESLYRLYQGTIEDCILHFETHYGKIDGLIYYDKIRNMIGFTGSQVISKGDRYVS
jgi:hypothetical protein